MGKPYVIDKRLVRDAWLRVRSNAGAAGVDGVSVKQFEKDLSNNLYKIWNRMSSGTYFPPPVQLVKIPKGDGGTRPLGVPTVGDRVAQMVVKMTLEPQVEPYFHQDSYGYRPHRSAHDALAITRKRCWQSNWVIDLDIRGFFDNLNHDLIMQALSRHSDNPWIKLYVRRWLEAPLQVGTVVGGPRTKGTPQGGVISPLLANLFMHYAFDVWMSREFSTLQFARYADDVIVHAVSERQARFVLDAIRERLRTCGLELHPEKTKIVYCKDDKRTEVYPTTSFDFLGYTFKGRPSKSRYGYFRSFLPAISLKKMRDIRNVMRAWRLHSLLHVSLEEIAKMINPTVRGWMNYYGAFYRSEFYKTINVLVRKLERWVMRKYRTFKRHPRRARTWLRQLAHRVPNLFSHWRWQYGIGETTGAV